VAAVIEIIEQCEIARFSPGVRATDDPQLLFQKARDVMGKV
jgi:hypothetical protein